MHSHETFIIFMDGSFYEFLIEFIETQSFLMFCKSFLFFLHQTIPQIQLTELEDRTVHYCCFYFQNFQHCNKLFERPESNLTLII